jgi:hypothetical protein
MEKSRKTSEKLRKPETMEKLDKLSCGYCGSYSPQQHHQPLFINQSTIDFTL